jgi:hypothetical protein
MATHSVPTQQASQPSAPALPSSIRLRFDFDKDRRGSKLPNKVAGTLGESANRFWPRCRRTR